MTLALVVLVVFLVVWFSDSAKKREEKQAYQKKTITNVKLQDELWCDNFKMIIADLEELDKVSPLTADQVMPTIESLFDKYDIPDRRTSREKQIATNAYLQAIQSRQDKLNHEEYRYPTDASIIPLPFKIIYYSYPHETTIPPHFNNPALIFGEPNTSKKIDGFEYEYDYIGQARILTEPHSLICRICNLLTERDLYEKGFNFSWNRQESSWQQSEQQIKEYKDKKKKYPWLYR